MAFASLEHVAQLRGSGGRFITRLDGVDDEPMQRGHLVAAGARPALELRLIHLADDPARTSVTDELIPRTNERRASDLGNA